MPIRLVATDLDGTLLRDDLGVSPRTRAALDATRAAGIHVVPVTARQPIGVRRIAEEAGFTDWAVCSNGSLGIHLGTGERLFESHLRAEVQQALVEALAERAPGVLCVSVGDGGEAFVAQDGYAALATFEDHKRDVATMGGHPLAEVLASPSLKLVVRHPDLAAEELADRVAALGVAAGEVLAFGDALNDVEMLTWAGRGVAVANAEPAVREAADEVTTGNQDDGVARVLEELVSSAPVAR